MRYFIGLDEHDLARKNEEKTPWSFPIDNGDGTWTPGERTPVADDDPGTTPDSCVRYSPRNLLEHRATTIFEVEPSPGVPWDAPTGASATRVVRLVRRMNWDDSIARSFACDCAEHVLPLAEILSPEAESLSHLIEISRLLAVGEATRSQLKAAVSEAKREAPWRRSPRQELLINDTSYLVEIPLLCHAEGAMRAALDTGEQSASVASRKASFDAQCASLGEMTETRVAVLRQAVREWHQPYRRRLPRCSPCPQDISDWESKYGALVMSDQDHQDMEAKWQERRLLEYLDGEVTARSQLLR